MTDPALKPCPFCGGRAKLAVEGEPGYESEWIECKVCWANIKDASGWNTRAGEYEGKTSYQHAYEYEMEKNEKLQKRVNESEDKLGIGDTGRG